VGVKAVLFDLGGTLLHYKREEVLRALLKEKRIDVSTRDILQAYNAVDPVWNELTAEIPQHTWWPDDFLEQFDHLILEHLGFEKEQGPMARFVRENWNRVDRELPHDFLRSAYPDVSPCLEGVTDLVLKMGIVSIIPSQERLVSEVEGMGLTKFFQVLVASGTVGAAKPNRAIFYEAATRSETAHDEILFVGDDLERDYEGAIRSGMKAVLVDRRGSFKDHGDTCRISSLVEIPKILREERT